MATRRGLQAGGERRAEGVVRRTGRDGMADENNRCGADARHHCWRQFVNGRRGLVLVAVLVAASIFFIGSVIVPVIGELVFVMSVMIRSLRVFVRKIFAHGGVAPLERQQAKNQDGYESAHGGNIPDWMSCGCNFLSRTGDIRTTLP